MRLGITLPNFGSDEHPLDAKALHERARMIEDAGFDSIWMPDHLPIPGEPARDRPDPLMWLAIAAHATERVELGTCIFAVPIRTKYDVAQRFFTLESLAPGRVTLGVGTGSQEREYEGAAMDWSGRFSLLRSHMAAVRATFDGTLHEEMRTDPGGLGTAMDMPTWPQRVGQPRFVLGAWVSEPQLRRAASEYDGWMTSAGPGIHYGGGKKVLAEGIKKFRAFGGRRAICSTVVTDLTVPTSSQEDGRGPFNLRCDAATARERLQWLADLGYDDVIIWPTAFVPRFGIERGGFGSILDVTSEHLAQWRSLVPKDSQDYRESR